MNLRPTGGRVLVVPDRRRRTVPTMPGAPVLHISDVDRWTPYSSSGRVLAASPDAPVKAGDRVVFDYRDVGNVRQMTWEGQSVLVFHKEQIKALLTATAPGT